MYFVMDHRIFRVLLPGWLFRLPRAIPIAPYKEDPTTYNAAFERAAQALRGRVHSARMFARWAIARMRGSSSSICASTVLPGA